jgi:23S rRNA (uracil-5-)-methyltransferase RumA
VSSAQRTEVVAVSLDEAGHGVGTPRGGKSAIHVTDLLPGEAAEVHVDHASPHKPVAWAHIVRRMSAPSVDRVEPACPGWGRCGGCVWQHLAYPAQLVEKHRRVAAALAEVPAVGAGRVAIAPVRPSPAVLGYRNKGKYVAGRSGDHVVLGAYAPRSHHVIDTLGCRVVAPVIDEVATWVRGAAEGAGLAAYDEPTRTGELRYVIIREADGDALVALVVTARTPRAKLEQVANALSRHPAIRSVVAIHNDRRDGAIVPSGSPAQVLFGKGALAEDIAGVRVEVGPGEFLQVNRAQATAMYARVAELAEVTRGTTRAVDLFAGVGGIGIHLARAGARVVALEIDREAVGQLRRAATRAGLPLTALAGDASELPAAARSAIGDAPDVVVVNPPRKGLSDGARSLVAQLAPRTLLYVSCGPEALGRDLALLAPTYEPDVIEPFDLMPGTAQIETVVRLHRSA